MDATNTTDHTAPNQATIVERMERNIYKIRILSDRKTDLTKTNPRMWREEISENIDLTYQKNLEELIELGTNSLDAQITHHNKGDVIWALGPNAKHEIIRGKWDKKTEGHQPTRIFKIVQEDILTHEKCIPRQRQILKIKQDNETLDEYWKNLVDIKRKCEYNRITPEETITYKFQPQ